MSTGRDETVVDALAEVWASTADACAGLEAADWDGPTDCPGWTVRDQLSHVAGFERQLAGEDPPALAGEVPGHVKNPIGEMNEAWVGSRRDLGGDEVLEEFVAVTRRRLADLDAMGTEEFDRVGWSPVGQVPYRDFLNLRVFDCWVHEQDIRRAVGRPGGRGGAGEARAVARVTSAMGYVVGRTVAPPEGTSVVFDVRGPLPSVVPVVMRDGRGRLVDDAPDAPSVRLTLDADTFVRLGCGRLTGAGALEAGSVTVTGDAVLGRRVLDSMNVMI